MTHGHLFFMAFPPRWAIVSLNLRKPGTGTAATWQRWWWAAWSARAARCLWASASITKPSAVRRRRPGLQQESSALRVSGGGAEAPGAATAWPAGLTHSLSIFAQRPLTWSWTPLWCSRRFTSRTDLCTCCTALPRRTVCPSPRPRPTGPTDIGGCSASPPRSTTSAGRTSSRRRGGTRGSGTPATGNEHFTNAVCTQHRMQGKQGRACLKWSDVFLLCILQPLPQHGHLHPLRPAERKWYQSGRGS